MTDRRVRFIGLELQISILYNLSPPIFETEISGYQSRYLNLLISYYGLA